MSAASVPPSARRCSSPPSLERRASACIHTHSRAAMLVTLLFDREFRITHHEMIKGIRVGSTAASLRYFDELVVPIIDNTPEEKDLTRAGPPPGGPAGRRAAETGPAGPGGPPR